MPTENVSITIRAKDLATRVFSKVQRALKSVGNVARVAAKSIAVIGVAAAAAVVGLTKLSKRGVEYVSVQRAFN